MIYKKILIVGGIGSGKTTLANKLSKKLKIKHYELDNIVYKRRDIHEKNKPQTRDKKLKSIIKRKKWIMEGFHDRYWTHSIYKKSDIVIILNIKLSTLKLRIIKRFLKRNISFKNNQKSNKKFKVMLKLLKYVEKNPEKNFKIQKEIAKRFDKKVLILNNKKGINNFLKNLK